MQERKMNANDIEQNMKKRNKFIAEKIADLKKNNKKIKIHLLNKNKKNTIAE